MWVTQSAWQTFLDSQRDERVLLTAELARLRQENVALHEQVAGKSRDVDWMRVRCNQLEQERAALLMKLNGVAVPVPTIVQSLGLTPQEQSAFQQMDVVGGEAEN
jgi:hypothetical protein